MASYQWPQESLKPFFFLLFSTIFIIFIIKKLININTNQNNKKLNLPPNPPKLPIIGNLHQLGHMPHLSLHHLAQQYGPLMFLQLGKIPTVVVSSAEMAEEVTKTHDAVTASRAQLFSAKQLFYGCTNIVFAPYGPYWRHVRRISITELLSLKRVQSFGFVRQQEVSRLVKRISESFPGTTNLSNVLGMYTNDVLCRIVFGRDFSEGGEYHRHGFQKMIAEYQELLGGFSLGDFFPALEFIHNLTGLKSKLRNTFQRFDRFFDEVIEEHLNPGRNKKVCEDLLDVLLDIQKNGSDETKLTMDNVKAVILDMFAAGTDTSFITLDWGMTELMMNPKVMKKAQSEIRSVLGERTTVLETDLPKFEYLKAVIKEILRKHPPGPFLVPRESTEDIVINGFDIPAKTRIYVNIWAISRDQRFWNNPETFDPERFMGNPIDYKGQNFEYLPFGAGRRICPGIAFGTATLELALAQLLHSFDWELPEGTKAEDLDLKEAFGMTMHRIENLIVIAKPHFSKVSGDE